MRVAPAGLVGRHDGAPRKYAVIDPFATTWCFVTRDSVLERVPREK